MNSDWIDFCPLKIHSICKSTRQFIHAYERFKTPVISMELVVLEGSRWWSPTIWWITHSTALLVLVPKGRERTMFPFSLAKNCFGDQGLATIGKQLRFTDLIIQCRNSQKNQLNFIRILASQTQFRADNKIWGIEPFSGIPRIHRTRPIQHLWPS